MNVDLFSGIGGWEQMIPMIGFESDPWACATRASAGLETQCVDLEKFDPRDYGDIDLLCASPPCQGFSTAGKQHPDDPRNWLVEEAMFWIEHCRPYAVAFEQVPPVLPIWEWYASQLRDWGYSVWTGLLHAEQYGAPQTRKRAILMASREWEVRPPKPTHSRYYQRDPQRLDPGVEPWISMAEALDWDGVLHTNRDQRWNGRQTRTSDCVAPTFTSEAGRQWKVRTRGNRQTSGGNVFDASGPMRALTEKARSWTVERPAPTLVATRRSDEGIVVGRQLPEGEERDPSHGGWTSLRDATTVVGSYNPDIVTPPGHRDWSAASGKPRQYGGVRITLPEALILQGFDPDYPVQGVKSRQFLQVGNAIPPPLANAILRALL